MTDISSRYATARCKHIWNFSHVGIFVLLLINILFKKRPINVGLARGLSRERHLPGKLGDLSLIPRDHIKVKGNI